MVQPGIVTLAAQERSATGPWMFMLDVDPGTYDLIAADASSILIERSQLVTTSETLPTIDVAANGTPLTSVPATIAGGLEGEVVGTDVLLITQDDGFVTLTTATSTLEVVPTALLVSSDAEASAAYATTATTYRYTEPSVTVADPVATSFALPPRLAGTFDLVGGAVYVGWVTLPTQGSVALGVYGASNQAVVTASQSWLAAAQASGLVFDTSEPGWMPAWSFWTRESYDEQLSVSADDVQDGYFYTSVSGAPGFAQHEGERRTGAVVRRAARCGMRNRHAIACP